MMIALLVLLGGALVVVAWVAGIYNQLVRLRNRFQNAFAQIDVQLKRRYDLIPNLVETAKGYLKHERETLEAVTRARNDALAASEAAAKNPGEPGAMKALQGAEGILGRMLVNVRAVAEQYPDLKANETMNRLMEELTSTENKISFARQAFNDAVTAYNTSRETFPNNIVAGSMNFTRAELFEVEIEEQREPVAVSFS
jgi:LemA protein